MTHEAVRMKPINPSITIQHYPLTKKGARNKYYLVKCRLVPCDEAPSGVYQKKHSTEAGAQQDRLRLIRLFGGGSLSKEEFRDAEMAIYRLRGNTGPAKGSSLGDAVDFYIANYKGADSTPLVAVAIKEFTDKKFRTLRPDSKEEYRRYLKAFGTQFGTMKLGQLGHESVGDFIESHVSKKPCYKIIHSFLGYCAGTSKKLKNPTPWLERNPADFYVLDQTDERESEIVILTVDEIRNCLAYAMGIGEAPLGDLPFWIWGLFTGMRPLEIKRFWTIEGYGWNRVHLEAGEISVPSEVSKVRSPRNIVIRPNLRAWLLFLKEAEIDMYPTRHRLLFRETRQMVLPEDKVPVRDLLRHTFISNRIHAFDRSFATTSVEAGNSERICKESYYRMISDPKAVEAFWDIRPETFGLTTPQAPKRIEDG
jgi:integrase